MFVCNTELGGIVLSPQPGPDGSKLKPGTCTRPFFGVEPVIVDQKVHCEFQIDMLFKY